MTDPFTVDDAINGLKHLADDHKCCEPFAKATIQKLEQLRDACRIALWIRDKLEEKQRWGHDMEEWSDIERAIDGQGKEQHDHPNIQ